MSQANAGSPKGGKITVDADERKLFMERRKALGLTQRQLAKKAHTTNGTISNLENGIHPQIKQETYIRLRFILFREKGMPDESNDDMIKGIADGVPSLSGRDLKTVLDLVSSLRKPR